MEAAKPPVTTSSMAGVASGGWYDVMDEAASICYGMSWDELGL